MPRDGLRGIGFFVVACSEQATTWGELSMGMPRSKVIIAKKVEKSK